MPILAIGMVLMMVRTVLMAKVLEVSAFAEFSGGLLVSSTFCMLACLGLYPLLQRDMPGQLFQAKETEASRLLLQALVASTVCLITALVALNAIPAFSEKWDIRQLNAGVLHGFAQQAFLLVTIESRSRGETLRFSWQNLWRAVALVAVAVLVATATGDAIYTLLAEAIVSIVVAAYVLARLLQRAELAFRSTMSGALRSLSAVPWKVAVTLLAVSIISFGIVNADRWIAFLVLSKEEFAIYSFAWIILTIAAAAQAIINAAAFPTLARTFAAKGKNDTLRIAASLSFALILGCTVLAAPVYWALAAIIPWWFPAYGDAQSVVLIFYVIAVLRLSDFWSGFLVVIGQERQLLYSNLFVVVIALAALASVADALRLGAWSIQRIALFALAVNLANFMIIVCLAWSSREDNEMIERQ